MAALSIESDLRTTIRNGRKASIDIVASYPPREQAMQELTQYAPRTPELSITLTDGLTRGVADGERHRLRGGRPRRGGFKR